MNLIGMAVAGIYMVVATRSAPATPGEAGGSQGTGGVNITCKPDDTANYTVSQPDTTLRVTFPETSSQRETSGTPKNYVYDASCSQPVVLSNICPGATVSAAPQDGEGPKTVKDDGLKKGTVVTLSFPQLPASQHVVCVKCPAESKSNSDKDCKAVITVAAAPPQGPQACAVGGTSITLEINTAGGSAQFKCGKDWTLEPTEPTKAYADDCSKVETLKDMTRGEKSDSGYVTVKAAKLKKKKLCYLCQPKAPVEQQRAKQDDSCKVYVQVSGSTKSSSGVLHGLVLPCLAAMLRLT